VRFNQVSDTPLFQEPIFSLIGPIGDGPGVESIFQGVDMSDDMDTTIRKVLQSLYHCDPDNNLRPITFTVED